MAGGNGKQRKKKAYSTAKAPAKKGKKMAYKKPKSKTA